MTANTNLPADPLGHDRIDRSTVRARQEVGRNPGLSDRLSQDPPALLPGLAGLRLAFTVKKKQPPNLVEDNDLVAQGEGIALTLEPELALPKDGAVFRANRAGEVVRLRPELGHQEEDPALIVRIYLAGVNGRTQGERPR